MDELSRARDLKQPLLDLENSGLIKLVHATAANATPLAAEVKEGVFKAQFLYIGLMLNFLRVDLGTKSLDEGLFANEGSLAEQFVGQEILALEAPDKAPQLFYWQRDVPGSEAEIDFAISLEDQIFPIDVKSGKTGTLKSLRSFMKEKDRKLGVRVSQHSLSMVDGVLSVPFYMCSQIPRLIRQAV